MHEAAGSFDLRRGAPSAAARMLAKRRTRCVRRVAQGGVGAASRPPSSPARPARVNSDYRGALVLRPRRTWIPPSKITTNSRPSRTASPPVASATVRSTGLGEDTRAGIVSRADSRSVGLSTNEMRALQRTAHARSWLRSSSTHMLERMQAGPIRARLASRPRRMPGRLALRAGQGTRVVWLSRRRSLRLLRG
jgi:hypothetical protein